MIIDNPIFQGGFLGQVISVSLSAVGAWSKSDWQDSGWAICDGTTPVAQGITDPTITTTDDLSDTFLRSSNDETSGSTGGADSHTHTGYTAYEDGNTDIGNAGSGNVVQNHRHVISSDSNLPSYYEVVKFIKVK